MCVKRLMHFIYNVECLPKCRTEQCFYWLCLESINQDLEVYLTGEIQRLLLDS